MEESSIVASVEKVRESFKRIDVLINNAGVFFERLVAAGRGKSAKTKKLLGLSAVNV